MVLLGVKVRILNNLLFNLDFLRSYADIGSSIVGQKIDAFPSHLLSLPFRFQLPLTRDDEKIAQ